MKKSTKHLPRESLGDSYNSVSSFYSEMSKLYLNTCELTNAKNRVREGQIMPERFYVTLINLRITSLDNSKL